ncbi:MAG: glycosyltransferase [Chitinophagaceae bacterium]
MSFIIIIGPAHPLRGGIAAFNERLAVELQGMGHRVILYSFSLQYPSFLFPGKTQYSDSPSPEGLNIQTKINAINPVNWLKVGKEIRKLNPDLVITRFWIPFLAPASGSILRQIKKNKHSKVVCIADNIIPHEKRPGDKELTNYLVKSCDAFVVMSKIVLEDLRKITLKPASLILHPLYDQFGEKVTKSAARDHLQLPAKDRLLLFFGLIRRYKGLDLLLNAIADPRVQTQHIKLVIAGEFYEDATIYKELIEKNKLQQSVFLHTVYIPDEQVKYYFSAADAVVLPYRNATQSGIAPIAYHFELPMISTNAGGLPDTILDGKTGILCSPDPVSLADAILRFYNQGEMQFAPFLREEKKKYSWKAMAEEILKLGFSPTL